MSIVSFRKCLSGFDNFGVLLPDPSILLLFLVLILEFIFISKNLLVQLSEVVKSGASSLGSPNREAQVMLINAVKDVASALADLMQSTKSASGKNIHDPAMHHLKESAKVSEKIITFFKKK